AAELLDGGLHDAVAEVRGGHVSGDAEGAPAQSLDPLDGVVCRLGVQVVDHDVGPVAGQAQSDLLADAASRAGDDGDLAVELSHGGLRREKCRLAPPAVART